jgi:hypothetical protein
MLHSKEEIREYMINPFKEVHDAMRSEMLNQDEDIFLAIPPKESKPALHLYEKKIIDEIY